MDKKLINKNETTLDIRLMRLAKSHIPQNCFLCNENFHYTSLGYFQMIDIRKIDVNSNNILINAFNVTSNENKTRIDKNFDSFSEQSVYLFRDNIKCEFEENAECFWEENEQILFCSMIHIKASEDNVAIKKKDLAQFIVENTGKKPIIYYTFDYSDFVIFYKDNYLSRYLNTIGKLVYSLDIVDDSYTLYCMNTDFIKKLKQIYLEEGKISVDNHRDLISNEMKDEKLYMSLNISTSMESCIAKIKNKVECSNNSVYIMFGRHDISIVNNSGNILWLIDIVVFLEEIIKTNSFAILTYESFVKTDIPLDLYEDTAQSCDKETEKTNLAKDYEMDFEKIIKYFNNLQYLLQKSNYLSRFIYPLYNINKSICSIAKNGFAEEFVISVIESYVRFLIALKLKVDEMNFMNEIKIENEFSKMISEFNYALNSQINGMMHSERQFIQSTSFNAIYYDVPPKLLAFYTTYTHKMIEIMRDENESNYSCLIEPNFNQGISVNSIIIHKDPPTDRIISIKINESTFFDIKSVLKKLAHEISHYAGNKVRNRTTRCNKIYKGIILYLINDIFGFEITNELNIVVKNIFDSLVNNGHLNDGSIYSEKIYGKVVDVYTALIENTNGNHCDSVSKIFKNNICKYIFDEFKYIKKTNKTRSFEIYNMFSECCGKYLDSNYLQPNAQRVELIKENLNFECIADDIYSKKFCSYLNAIRKKHKKRIINNFYSEICKPIVTLYSETFADINSIVIQKITYEDYLQGFLYSEKINTLRLEKDVLTIIRILSIKKVLFLTGIWVKEDFVDENLIRFDRYLDDTDKRFELYNGIIQDKISKNNYSNFLNFKISPQRNNVYETEELCFTGKTIENSMYGVLYLQLCDYLVDCLNNILIEYGKEPKYNKIVEIRKSCEIVSEFEDMTSVFQVINDDLLSYKKDLSKLIASIDD